MRVLTLLALGGVAAFAAIAPSNATSSPTHRQPAASSHSFIALAATAPMVMFDLVAGPGEPVEPPTQMTFDATAGCSTTTDTGECSVNNNLSCSAGYDQECSATQATAKCSTHSNANTGCSTTGNTGGGTPGGKCSTTGTAAKGAQCSAHNDNARKGCSAQTGGTCSAHGSEGKCSAFTDGGFCSVRAGENQGTCTAGDSRCSVIGSGHTGKCSVQGQEYTGGQCP